MKLRSRRTAIAVAALGLSTTASGLAAALPPAAEPTQPLKPPTVTPGSAPTARPIIPGALDGGAAAVACASTAVGGLTSSSPCTVSVLWDSAKHIGAVTIKGTSGGNPDVTFGLWSAPAPGGLPPISAYTVSMRGPTGGTNPPIWYASPGVGTVRQQGMATMRLSSVTPTTATGTVQEYLVHGTMNATLLPGSGGATNSVSLSITF